MSKILFVTKKITTNSLNQIEIIKRSGHEFTVVTSQSEKLSGLIHSDTLYFFSRWNFLELIKFLPSFMIINPDVVHVFIDSKSSAHTADFFAALTQIFNKIFSIQFYLSEDSFLKIPKAKRLVYLADVVTGPHRSFLYQLRGMRTKNKYQIKGVIPPVLHLAKSQSIADSLPIDLNGFQSYQLLVPLKKNLDEFVIQSLAQRFSVLFVLERKAWSPADIKKLNQALTKSDCRPWRILPLESLKNLASVPSTSLSLWIAGLDYELDECIQFFEFSLNRKIKIIMDQTQTRLYPDLWENNPMASLVAKMEILKYISQFQPETMTTDPEISPSTEVKNDSFTNNQTDRWIDPLKTTSLVDVSVNEFNRLISKATNTQNDKAV